MAAKYKLDDLLYLMQRLRDPASGCPWDLAQSYASIVPSTLEEAYEVTDTIERGDLTHLEEELGDLLFQVVFYARLGEEDGLFSFNSIVNSLTSKLLRRHPHVFASGNLYSESGENATVSVMASDGVKKQWESIKSQERADKGKHGQLADVPLNFPSVTRAQKLQKRASQVGFDFGSIKLAMEKVHEELAEVEAEIALLENTDCSIALGQELGDLIFSVINVCRLASFDAETLLRSTNKKFEKRFSAMEQVIEGEGQALKNTSLQDMEAVWQQVKQLD
ncbi:nucleoside triphosphate pyrophosphohydrolase [Simiduia curdlanivorans]|uniref:Nucleoside triphosphate pyrophosphohydrolase n=1 Tax=Simiduia curdlanivorans TaxID=1492769 RepID=A0ABV8V7J1_9GAMM|nr:nucleoside triphosphate pyrophosphohydrolase [Simiduia curdlanivorans]MDN3639810.1 nucleoside triphosphate pyrophosphohydrolase [Simiduia curdlanivorans]